MSALKTLGSHAGLAWTIAGLAIRKFGEDDGLFLASGLAFNLLLYAIPLALIMISLLGYTVLESDQAMEEVQAVIRQFLPHSEQAFAAQIAAIAADRGLLGVAGFGSFVLFSTIIFSSIRYVLNVVFRADIRRSLLRGTAHDLVMMVFCTGLLVAAIGLASLFTLFDSLDEMLPGPAVSQGVRLAERLGSLLLGGSLVFWLYRFSPVKKLSTRSLVIGSAVTVALFEFAKQAFNWYVRFAEAAAPLYGVLGAFVFLFFWLYYASVIFVLGAEAGWAFEQTGSAHRPELSGLAVPGNEAIGGKR